MQFIRNHLISYCSIVLVMTIVCFLGGRMAAQVIALTNAAPAEVTVVIDAGHGGEDGGAVSASGVQESRLNLAVAMRTYDLFCLMGQQTVLLRTDDVSLHSPDAETIAEKKVSDLKNRVLMTENTENPVLLSIHQNMFQEEKYHGAQVFYAATDGSRELAETIQANVKAVLDMDNHRAVKPAEAVYLMNHVTCTAVLVECGFLSNREEFERLCTPEYQKQLAVVLAGSLNDYLRKVNTNEV